ncbi:hypothetical protein ACJRO7_035334 [Eucalyptus globulus]|uniref:Uncharacterized protein n=1 Tax=Eucalyptus globulus TaxID=34317 RepID=A0ABD3JAS1_EUCGL
MCSSVRLPSLCLVLMQLLGALAATGDPTGCELLITAPYSETFFRHPFSRFCGGHLIIKFIDFIETNFRPGANFVTSGSSIQPGAYSLFHLATVRSIGIQISQFVRLKPCISDIYNPLNQSTFSYRLPRPQDFSKAFYTLIQDRMILRMYFKNTSMEQVIASIPDILSQISQAVHQLYEEVARVFWVHDTGPVVCHFNKQLKDRILQLREQLLEAVTRVDVYSAKYSLIRELKDRGFVDLSSFCHGSYYGYHINCGKQAIVNGTVYGNPCEYPSKRISWDGFHYTEAANKWVASRILSGSFSYPAVSIRRSCHASENP